MPRVGRWQAGDKRAGWPACNLDSLRRLGNLALKTGNFLLANTVPWEHLSSDILSRDILSIKGGHVVLKSAKTQDKTGKTRQKEQDRKDETGRTRQEE